MSNPASDTGATIESAQERLEDQYIEALRVAVDAASSSFFSTHSNSLSDDACKKFVAQWCEQQKREPYRPAIKLTSSSTDGHPSEHTRGGRKKVRGYIDGCYDIMHSGHYNAIRQAKSLCDELVVGVHTCKEIEHHKGPPVMNDEERLAAVRACKWVDKVEFGVPYTPSIALLDQLGCDFAVHGDDDATTADGKDAFAEAKAAGRMAIVKRTEGVSTTDLVNRLLAMTKAHHTHTVNGALASSPNPASPAPSSSSSSSVHAISSFLPTTWRISQFANHRVPKSTDKVVYIAGSWDLFHLGHIQRLEEAKKLGTFLYVGVYDDVTINGYKGRNFPIMNVHERVLNVLSCVHVDEVVIGAPFEVTRDMLKTLNVSTIARAPPSEHAKERAARNASLHPPHHAHRAAVPDPCGLIQGLVPVTDVFAVSSLDTGDVIQRILDNRQMYEERNRKKAAKDDAYATKKAYVAEV